MRENADNKSKSGDKCEQIAVHGVIIQYQDCPECENE